MNKLLLIAALGLMPSMASAQADPYFHDKVVARSSGTINLVQGSSQTWTLTDAPQMAGSDYVVIQSTYAGGKFCWSFESTASSQTATTGGKSCERAEKEPGGDFWVAKVSRWHQNLRIYTLGLDTATSPMFRVRQQK